MKKNITIHIDEDILLRFNMALQLNNANMNEVLEDFMKDYFAKCFSKELNDYSATGEINAEINSNSNYGKALNKIAKWASRSTQINYKILRAYLQLAEESEVVTYNALMNRCSNEQNHSDTYVATFSSNFAQMKFDGDKSHGKVFIVQSDGTVELWDYIESEVMRYRDDFLKLQSTDSGYINKNNQLNIGKTALNGSDHLQKLYMMRCLEENCGYEYLANGSDIFQKKCPKCQNGVFTMSDESANLIMEIGGGNLMKDMLLTLKNKDFAFRCISILVSKGRQRDIECLKDKDFCKSRFDMNYPILREVNLNGEIQESSFLDSSMNRRYYPNSVIAFGRRYIVCNDWYYNNKVNTRDTKSNFVNWILEER